MEFGLGAVVGLAVGFIFGALGALIEEMNHWINNRKEHQMSLYGYRESLELAKNDVGFYALIMAAMRKADTDNVEKLKRAWPEVWEELKARYHAPGGMLPEDHAEANKTEPRR